MADGFLTEADVNLIRGFNLVKQAGPDDISKLIAHIDALEALLEEAEEHDAFGALGWREYAGINV